jgi:shikimate dehydrogenase
MHNANFRALGMDAIYLAFDVDPARLMEVLPAMAHMGFRGVNLTVPLKEVAFRGLSQLDESARRLGAVNTVEFSPSGLKGHNTDGKGFVLAVKEALGIDLSGQSVFVLGSGGAGRAVAITCAAEGASRIAVTDVDFSRAQRVAKEIRDLTPSATIDTISATTEAWVETSREADLVVQATPVGMKKSEQSLLPPHAFRKGQKAFDLIYMYPETPFMKAAAKGGARTSNGLGMLLHQGAWAFTVWTGQKADVDVMRKELQKSVYRPKKEQR